MNKPESLRAHLLTTVAELQHNPDLLLIFIDNGKVRCTAAATLSFEYSYDLQIIFTAFAGHPDSVILPVLGWISINQPELLENYEKMQNGIQFEADILDKDEVDLGLKLRLTELRRSHQQRVLTQQNPDCSKFAPRKKAGLARQARPHTAQD